MRSPAGLPTEMRLRIVGPASPLRHAAPEVATVLFYSWPSGNPNVVACRNSIMMSEIHETNVLTFESMVPEIVHVKDTELFPPLACNEVYVGNGVEGCNYFVPSRWATPFAYGMDSGKAKFSRAQFKRYALTRKDREEWLRPLFGKRLICSCQSKHCHTGELIDLVSEELQAQLEEQQTCEELPEAPSQRQQEDEEKEVEWDSPDASRETMWAANETLGTKVPEVSQKPGWPDAWHLLLVQLRPSTTLLF